MNNGILICIPIIIACIWFANSKSSEYNQKKRELEDFARKLTVRKNELDKTEASLNVKKANISAKDMEINNRINALKGLEIIFSSKISTIPVLSKFFADIKMEKEKHLVGYLKSKSNRAPKAAEIVEMNNMELRELRAINASLEYKLLAYESKFPFLKSAQELSLLPDNLNQINLLAEDLEKQKKELSMKLSMIANQEQYIRDTVQKRAREYETEYLKKSKELENIYHSKEHLLSLRETELHSIFAEKQAELEKQKFNIHSLLAEKQAELEKQKNNLKIIEDAKNNELKEAEHIKQLAETEAHVLRLKVSEIPVLSAFVADVNAAQDERISDYFLMRRYKSVKASDFIKERKKQLRELSIENKNLQYKLLYYESLFPVLKEYDDEPVSVSIDIPDYDDKKGYRVHYWLTPAEYETLSVTERNQRALDRYWNRNKTHSDIGADYEKSIGYWEYEKKGWRVTYFGIDKGLEDMGRDLICISPNKQTVHIVQCKCWSSKKEIHENHINQLFGTTVRYFLEKNHDGKIEDFIKELEHKNIVPVFYTTTKLSDTAKSFAESLGIVVHEEIPLRIYPLIKCNINRRTQEKIYHLPFDQQYDNIVIDPPEEFIALTVAEAERAGFRRAHKWFGN